MANFWQSSNLDIYIWDVGHGLSVTIISPYVEQASGMMLKRRRIVQIDAGSNFETQFFPSNHLVNNRKASTIDCLVISHADKDHIDDLVNIDDHMKNRRLEILTLLRNNTLPSLVISDDRFEECQAKKVFRKLHETYTSPCPEHHKLTPVNFGGIAFESTYLPYREDMQDNDTSVVTSIRYGSLQIIIPGDLEEGGAAELIYLGRMPKAHTDAYRVLLAPHHGSETAKPLNILKHYKPHVVLASVESGNEHSDSLYSQDELVSGHPIVHANGTVVNYRFCGTKGEAFHIEADGRSHLIRKFAYN